MEKILIVEDEIIVAEALTDKLRTLGYEVCGQARSGDEALSIADRLHPALVLMDIRIEGAMDGIETAAILRRKCDVPVVFLTAHSDRATLERAKHTESFGYLLKPFENRALESTIQMAIYKHRSEREQRETNERLQLALKAGQMGAWEWDLDARSSVWNASEYELLGLPPGEGPMAVDIFFSHVHPDDRPGFEQSLAGLMAAGRDWTREFRIVKADGAVRWLAGAGTLYRDAAGKPVRMLGVNYDITLRKEAEARQTALLTELRAAQDELLRRERLATMGKLASSVAHEMRSPLNVIQNAVHFLEQTRVSGDAELAKLAGEMNRALDSSNHIINEMLDYVREAPPKPVVFSLGEAMAEALRLAPRTPTVRLHELSAGATGLLLLGDQDQITRLLVNLLQNAIQAMPQGGDLELAANLEEGGKVAITVRDTGCGIAAENLEKIFEPLFSTKTRGIGLGLAIAKRYAQLNGGDLAVESELGRGTAFTLRLNSGRATPRSG